MDFEGILCDNVSLNGSGRLSRRGRGNRSLCGRSACRLLSVGVHCDSPQTIIPPSGCSRLSSLLQPRLTGDKLLLSPPQPPEAVRPPRDLLTWSAELAYGGAPRLVVDAAQAAAFGHAPGGAAGPAVPLLGRVVEVHVGGALRQVLAVVAQAVLGDLDGVEVALRTPLGGQRNAWAEGEGRTGWKRFDTVFEMRERGRVPNRPLVPDSQSLCGALCSEQGGDFEHSQRFLF